MKKLLLFFPIYIYANCDVFLQDRIPLTNDGIRYLNESFVESFVEQYDLSDESTKWKKYVFDNQVCSDIELSFGKIYLPQKNKPSLFGFILYGKQVYFIEKYVNLYREDRNIFVPIDSIPSLKKNLMSVKTYKKNYDIRVKKIRPELTK